MKKRLMLSVIITFIADGLTKLIGLHYLSGKTIDFSPFLRLYCTRNTGIAFGMFEQMPWIGLAVAPLLVAVCALWSVRYQTKPLTQVACGMVLGGFAGNWLERLIFGSVLDMIAFPFLPFFVCNVADIAICAGMAEIALSLLFDSRDWIPKGGTPS